MRLSILMAGVLMLLVAVPSLAAERDIMSPRVSPKEIEIARALKNPLPQNSKTIAKGKAVYQGKGSCVLCHGVDGQGNGLGAPSLDPSPRNFRRPGFWRHRTDGEVFWTIKHGSFGTGMVAYGDFLTDEEIWAVISYVHTFADGMEHGKGMDEMGSALEDRPMRPHEGGCCPMPEQRPREKSQP